MFFNELKGKLKINKIIFLVIIFFILVAIIYFIKKIDNHRFINSVFTGEDPIWTIVDGKPLEYDLAITGYEGDYKICFPGDCSENIYISYKDYDDSIILFAGSEEYSPYEMWDYLPDYVSEIKSSDINFDKIPDLIIIGFQDRAEKIWCFEGQFDYDKDYPTFLLSEIASDAVMKYLKSDYKADDVVNYFTKDYLNGKFKSYQEAYSSIVDYYVICYKDGVKYDLHFLDGDDVPELIIDYVGNALDIYTFKEGTAYKVADFITYGPHDTSGFKYVPYDNTIYICQLTCKDYRELINLGRIENDKVKWCYTRYSNFWNDLDHDDVPDEEEITDEALESFEPEIFYSNYTDDELTDEQLKEEVDNLIELEYLPLHGTHTSEEIKANFSN